MGLRSTSVLIGLVCAAFATAPAAYATDEPVEAITEAGGVHCGAVSVVNHEASGECEVVAHDVQSSHLGFPGVLISAGGSPLTACHWEVESYIAEEGAGLFTHQQLTDTPSNQCFLAPCAEETGVAPWPFQITEEAGVETLIFTLCINAGGGDVVCTLGLDAQQFDHHYLLKAEDSPCLEGTGVEFTGEWESEPASGQTNVELLH